MMLGEVSKNINLLNARSNLRIAACPAPPSAPHTRTHKMSAAAPLAHESAVVPNSSPPTAALIPAPARVPGELETDVANMRIIGAGVGADPIPVNNMSGAEAVTTTVCDVCIPPLGVAMATGSGGETLINCALWLFGWFPGVIHSLAVTYSPFSFTGVGKARAAAAQAGLPVGGGGGGVVAAAPAVPRGTGSSAAAGGGGGTAPAPAPAGVAPALQVPPGAAVKAAPAY